MSKPLRILLSNDDGIHAPGLEILEAIARELSDDVWICCPETEQSGASHALTLHEPLRLKHYGPHRYSVTGTPTDCVMMAVRQLMVDNPPDLVLSGVNRGANSGEDVIYSGTVAAAMEGTLLGVPSIAMSQQYLDPDHVPWDCAKTHGAAVVRKLLANPWPDDVMINVNFPPVAADMIKGIDVAAQGRRDTSDIFMEERIDPRRNPYYWIGFRRHKGDYPKHVDLYAIDEGFIAVTPLWVDLTHQETLTKLGDAIAGPL